MSFNFHIELHGRTPIEMTFGFYLSDHPLMKSKDTQPNAIIHNICNFADWIPLVGIISGLVRGIFIAIKCMGKHIRLDKDLKTWMIIEAGRGVVSGFGFGFMLIIPDLLFTLHGWMAKRENPILGLGREVLRKL